MKTLKFTSLVILVLALLVTSALSLVSFADGATDTPAIETEEKNLTSGDDNYKFFAQTRKNRYVTGMTDVRIICVAKQEWIDSIPSFVATFTFTDGTTPVTLKSVGLDEVYKSVTATCLDGTVETYTAEEGYVIFGWVVTEVPESYTDIATNAPTVKVDTTAGVKPDITPEENPVVQKNDTFDITGGMGKLGGFNKGTKSFTLTGNYNGLYKVSVKYAFAGTQRALGISINDDSQVVLLSPNVSDNSEAIAENATTVDFYFVMQNGENIITLFRGKTGYTPAIFSMSFERVGSVDEAIADKGATREDIFSSKDEVYDEETGATNPRFEVVNGVDVIRYLMGNTQTVTYQVENVAAGKYMLVLTYTTTESGRSFGVYLDESAESIDVTCEYSSNSADKKAQSVLLVDLTEGTHTFEIGGPGESYTGDLMNFKLIPITE